MLQLTAVRLAAIVLTVVLAKVSPNVRFYQSLVFSIALGHFVIGYVYSRAQITRAVSDWRSAGLLGTLLAFGIWLYWRGFNIVWFFALHHALNETFILDRFTSNAKADNVRLLRAAGFAFNIALYFAFVRRQIPIANAESLVIWGVVSATVLYIAALFNARSALSLPELAGHSVVEIAGLSLLFISFRTNVSVIHIACYHFVFWALYPGVQIATAHRYRGLAGYVVLTAVVTAAFVFASPINATAAFAFTPIAYAALFTLQSNIHISLSFLLSRTNPQFLVKRQFVWASKPLPS